MEATGDTQTTLSIALAAIYARCDLSSASASESLAQTAATVMTKCNETETEAASVVLCWLARALLLRDAEPLASKLTAHVVSLCAAGSTAAGRAFAILASAHSPAAFGLVAPLDPAHRARVAAASFSPLLAALQQPPPVPASTARALATVLDCAPVAVVAQEVVPHALAAIADSHAESYAETDAVLALVAGAVRLGVLHPEADVVARLSVLATRGQAGRTRAGALEVLRAVPRCLTPAEVRMLSRIVRAALACALDDPKRPVRMAAVRAGSAWDVAEHPDIDV